MSSRSYLVDLIESIGEEIALTSHIEEKLRGDSADTEHLVELLKKVLASRREKMSYLLERADSPDPTYSCQFKHAMGAFWRQQEVWEFTNDPSDLARLKRNGEILAMVTSLYLGMEFKTCLRCLEEVMLERQLTNKES